jgi:hypothetical protein
LRYLPKSGDLIAKALVVREKTSLNERTLKPNNTETLPDGSLRECFSWFQRSATYIIQMTYSDGHDAIYWADSFRGAPSGLVSARKPEQRDWRKGH